MQSASKLNTFDKVIKQVVSRHLQKFVNITEKTSVIKAIQDNQWGGLNTTIALTAQGDCRKIDELRKLQTQLSQQAINDPESCHPDMKYFRFLFRQSAGDRMIKFHNLKSLYNQETIIIEHNPGEVLVINVWATWCGPSQQPMQQSQDMLLLNGKAWGNSVRVIGLSIDQDEPAMKQQIEQRKWTAMEHLSTGSKGRHHEFCQSFGINSIPEIVLVDKAGVIVYAGHPGGYKLQDKISELLIRQYKADTANKQIVKQKQGQSTTVEHSKHIHGLLDEKSWYKFLQIFSNPPEVSGLNNLKLLCSRTRTYKNGHVIVQVEPLMIRFRYDDLAVQLYQKLIKTITNGLTLQQYKIRSFTDNHEKQLNSFYNGVDEILKHNGFNHKPVVKQRRLLNVCKDTNWTVHRTIGYPNIPYDGQTPYNTVDKTIKDIVMYHGELKEWPVTPLDALRHVSPLTLTNHKFAGIHELKDYRNGSDKHIGLPQGKLQFIVAAQNDECTEKHLRPFVQFCQNHIDETHLHIIVLGGVQLPFIDQLVRQEPININIYRADHTTNQDIRIMGFESYKHTVVVYPSGIVAMNGRFDNYEWLENFLRDQLNHPITNKPLSAEFIELLEHLPQNETIRQLNQIAKLWNYPAIIEVTVNDEFPNQLLTNRHSYLAVLKIAVREQHKPLVQPLIKLLEKQAKVTAEYIAVVDLPLGENCHDCGIKLHFPYYYFFVSKVHRCVDCTENQNKLSVEKLKRYTIMENSVLLFDERSVDVKRLGLNIQPETEEDCRPHSFECNGCIGDSANDARYICMGCHRQPNKKDYVDFCVGCITKFRETNQQAKLQIVKHCERDGHKLTHPLLRVLYCVKSYGNF